MQNLGIFASAALASLLCGPTLLPAQSDPGHHAAEPKARDLGNPFNGTTEPFNAITDVAGGG